MSDYYPMGGRFSNPFQPKNQYGLHQYNSSTQFRQHHEMKSEMPSDVLELFRANQIGFLKAPVKKKCRALDPVCTLGMDLNEVFAIPNLELMEEQKKQTKAQRNERIAHEQLTKHNEQVDTKLKEWNPFSKERITVDPYNTLFVGRLSYKTTEKDLKYEFERYGLVKSAIIPKDQDDKPTGYGFVEFQLHDDFVTAYKHANNRRINGRRVVVDFERGRTSLSWRPRRLDGGLGGEFRMTGQDYDKYMKELKAQKQQKREKSKGRERSRSKKRDKKREGRDDDRYERDRDDRDYYKEKDPRKRERRSKDRRDKKDKKERRDRRE